MNVEDTKEARPFNKSKQGIYTFLFLMFLVYIFTFVGEMHMVCFKFEMDDQTEELSHLIMTKPLRIRYMVGM